MCFPYLYYSKKIPNGRSRLFAGGNGADFMFVKSAASRYNDRKG